MGEPKKLEEPLSYTTFLYIFYESSDEICEFSYHRMYLIKMTWRQNTIQFFATYGLLNVYVTIF